MTGVRAGSSGVIDQFRLAGRRALVTGAGRGIGRQTAVVLAELGASVVGVSRTRSDLDELAGEIGAAGGELRACPADVTEIDQVEALVSGLDGVDILVNCAGGNIPEPFLEVSVEHLRQLIDLNLTATFLVSQTVGRKMIEADGGAIVNLSSQMGHVGAARRTVYCATKHAVEGLTKAMAVELAPHGIRVNAVAPTFIETPMTASFFEDAKFRAEVEEQIPLGRIGDASDVATAVAYLASPAASLVTGASLLVDGGWTAK